MWCKQQTDQWPDNGDIVHHLRVNHKADGVGVDGHKTGAEKLERLCASGALCTRKESRSGYSHFFYVCALMSLILCSQVSLRGILVGKRYRDLIQVTL